MITDLTFILPLIELMVSHENANTFLAAKYVEKRKSIQKTHSMLWALQETATGMLLYV